jgi:hypothetical protein
MMNRESARNEDRGVSNTRTFVTSCEATPTNRTAFTKDLCSYSTEILDIDHVTLEQLYLRGYNAVRH